MRIVFVNLHTNEMLVKTANKYIFKQAVAIKHKYFLNFLLSRPNIQVCNYINEGGFSVISNLGPKLMSFLSKLRYLEYNWVMKKNGIDKKKIVLIKNINDIRKDDLIIIYRLGGLYEEEKDIDAFKVVDMIHFTGYENESKLMEIIAPNYLINEANLLTNCKIFKKYYSWYKDSIYVYPFVPESRFQKLTPFNNRKNIVFSTGTITYKKNKEFIETYGDPCDQPIRKYVKDHRCELDGIVDCYNFDFSENATKKMEITGHESKMIRLIKGAYYKFFASQQKTYFSFDMVEKFNEYKMFLIGEEILGIPGIGFVEGMSCGTAYIGQRGYYEEYGMKESVHYIAYDGTPDDLKKKIQYYQMSEHQEELERIATNGYRYAHDHFDGITVAKNLLEHLINQQERWAQSSN